MLQFQDHARTNPHVAAADEHEALRTVVLNAARGALSSHRDTVDATRLARLAQHVMEPCHGPV